MSAFKIWVDADACPRDIAEIIVKAAVRLKLESIFVANKFYRPPVGLGVSFQQVGAGADVADAEIVAQSSGLDIVITQDIPLAGELVKKGILAINPRGDLYTASSIAERLSIRNFMTDLRSAGISTGGPRPAEGKDKAKFASTLDATLTKRLKEAARITPE